jgi:looped-hinge helix DNA binding domain, AbrB family
MSTRGITRKLDELGRITIPMEIRKTLNINVGDKMGMYINESVMHLVKASNGFTGIARNLDELGRWTIPMECRRTLGFQERQKLDIYVIEGEILIEKQGIWCAVCNSGNVSKLIPVKESHLCTDCIHEAMKNVNEN